MATMHIYHFPFNGFPQHPKGADLGTDGADLGTDGAGLTMRLRFILPKNNDEVMVGNIFRIDFPPYRMSRARRAQSYNVEETIKKSVVAPESATAGASLPHPRVIRRAERVIGEQPPPPSKETHPDKGKGWPGIRNSLVPPVT
ncbi:hypothetical protein CDAR_489181 [Caerostris darwini]|uniref:Uncharacterized protein n=1 Tax=Caerostris darwini TaxID=1538125 RepID=A0AAV4SZQ9_9ARAC|nr:hypothetical protein CDAR_489181 [Caerostris darwini]